MKFAAYNYSTDNLGDDMQTLAAIQFLPRVDFWINRDRLAPSRDLGPVCLIAHGWYIWNPALLCLSRLSRVRGLTRLRKLGLLTAPAASLPCQWPPPANIEALLISMHMARESPLMQKMLGGPSLAYLRSRGPVGCRDEATVTLLREAGVDAWFSGCLTLALQRPEVARGDEILFVDVEGIAGPGADELACMPAEAARRRRFLTHETRVVNGHERRRQARELLARYAAAQLVVTSRLHCALPCLAMGTPVLLVKNPDDPRFQGLLPLLRHCPRPALEERLAAMDWINPPPNPADIRPLAEPLRQRCEDHVRQFTA